MNDRNEIHAALATVSIYRNGNLAGTTTTNSKGEWSYDAKGLPAGSHELTARVGATRSAEWKFDIQQNIINPTEPFVHHAKVKLPVNGSQHFTFYDIDSDIEIVVPNYNMLKDDTVKLYWVGRNTTYTPKIQTVPTPPGPLSFVIPKYEVADVIDYSTTKIHYTVRRNGTLITSRILSLDVTANAGDRLFEPPSLNTTHDNIRVQKQSAFANSTVEVHAIGKTQWRSDIQTFGNAGYLNFSLDKQWLAANKGTSVIFFYRVRLKPADGNSYKHSQALRYYPL